VSHQTDLFVRFYELDPYDHVNHSVYVQYFEAARAQWLTEIGFPLHKLNADGIRIVVTELHTRYLGSAGPSEVLTVESELVEMRRASMTFEQRIRRGDEILVTQTLRAATVSEAGRPTRVPESLVQALRDE
jgi:acyl-CoA thioester hydrolase